MEEKIVPNLEISTWSGTATRILAVNLDEPLSTMEQN